MRAFRAPARIGAPRSLAAQRRLARDDNLTSFLQPEKTKLHHYRCAVVSPPEKRNQVAAAVRNMQDQHNVVLFDAMDDDIVVSRKAAQAGAQIVITPPSQVRMPGKQPKTLSNALDDTSGNIDAAALASEANPDVVKFRFRFGRKTKLAHHRVMFCSAASRAMPRRFISPASCATSSWVVIRRPSPRAKDASALSTAASISNRRRSRSSQSNMASCTASSS